jgi:TolB-like protein/DNA-binding winged helix-turn-helix (wHTH) protein/cytochrome c-type biogenesis protein CcmH/NrfG
MPVGNFWCDLVKHARTVSFGPFKFEPSSGRLTKHGHRVKLQGKSAEILRCLLEQPGQLVTRAEMEKRLWPAGTYVDYELGVRVALKKLRDALDDSADDAVYIQTVRGEGYRFTAPVKPEAEEPVAWGSTLVAGEAVGTSAGAEKRTTSGGPPARSQTSEQGRDGAPASTAARQWFTRQRAAAVIVVGLCIAVFSTAVVKLRSRTLRQAGTTKTGKVMVVVLPFENLSGDPNQEYLSDGMTEELSTQLGNLTPQRLAVIARTSAVAYKHSPKSVSQIGKELGVAYVVEGSVRRQGTRLRVTAQLVEVSDQAHVWAADYDREIRDLVQLEDDVARQITRQVGISLAHGEPQKWKPYHPSSEAHEAYLLGRYYWNKRTPAGYSSGERYFRRAIQLDPQYSAAYAGLAESGIATPEAEAVALKAVQLDPDSGEARTALGFIQLFRQVNVPAAERTLKTAIELDPNYATAHHWYAFALDATGRSQAAMAEITEAARLDPLSLIIRSALASELSANGQHDAALAQLRFVFDIDPHFAKAHEELGRLYERKGCMKQLSTSSS